MTLVEQFNHAAAIPGNSTGPFLGILARAMDELARDIRELPGYSEVTAPRLLPADGTSTWEKAIGSANGWGDILARIRAMSETLDEIRQWVDEQDIPLPATVVGTDRFAKARAAKAAKAAVK